jgi:LacI family transcriptional regulator
MRCPDDISVVSHNDMPLMDTIFTAAYYGKIKIEHRELSRTAARMLIDKIRQASGDVRHIVLIPELVVRGSTRTNRNR